VSDALRMMSFLGQNVGARASRRRERFFFFVAL
jgi:hypothetical protein